MLSSKSIRQKQKQPKPQKIERSTTYRHVGVTRAPLGVRGREDGVDKHKGADNLSAESCALAVTSSDRVGTTAERVEVVTLEGLDQPNSGNSSQALGYDVRHGPDERDLTGQEKAESHSRVNVAT